METECLKQTMNMNAILKQTAETINEQNEEIRILQTKSFKTKQESDKLLIEKEIKLKVKIHKNYKKHII